jgi:hypothetical protein
LTLHMKVLSCSMVVLELFLGKHHSWFLPENGSLDFQLLSRLCTAQNNFSFFNSVRENVILTYSSRTCWSPEYLDFGSRTVGSVGKQQCFGESMEAGHMLFFSENLKKEHGQTKYSKSCSCDLPPCSC